MEKAKECGVKNRKIFRKLFNYLSFWMRTSEAKIRRIPSTMIAETGSENTRKPVSVPTTGSTVTSTAALPVSSPLNPYV